MSRPTAPSPGTIPTALAGLRMPPMCLTLSASLRSLSASAPVRATFPRSLVLQVTSAGAAATGPGMSGVTRPSSAKARAGRSFAAASAHAVATRSAYASHRRGG